MTLASEESESLISEGEPLPGLPGLVRLVIAAVALGFLVVSGALMWAYVQDPQTVASPQDLQLGNLILAAVALLLLALVPWHKLGIRIRRIGAIEFDRIVSTQANEYAEEFSEIRSRVMELEKVVQGLDEMSGVSKYFASQTLRPLVLNFLDAYQPKAFSPRRIREWGSRQPGFGQLEQFDQGMVRRVLQDLVADGQVATRVSRLGNTLYKVAD